ncbi:MAG: ABC transporter substrate-binding protein [Gammaproteobacteria bacterium]
MTPGRAGRRACIALLLLAIVDCVAFSSPAHGQRAYEVVMVLPRAAGDTERAFEQYFAELGVVVNVQLLRYSGRDADQRALYGRLRELAPDLIYTWDTPTTLAVAGPADGDRQRYIRDIPIVFTSVADPVAAGLLHDPRRPGRNVTGVIPLAPLPAQIKAITAYRAFQTLGFVYDPGRAATLAVRDQLRTLAREQGFKLVDQAIPANAAGELETAAIERSVAGVRARGAQFLYLGPETFVSGPLQQQVAHAAIAQKLPTFSALEEAVRRHGVLFGLVSPARNVGRLAAIKALRILREHVPPEEIPVETLPGFTPLINIKTALAIEAYPPLLLLEAADIVTPDDLPIP